MPSAMASVHDKKRLPTSRWGASHRRLHAYGLAGVTPSVPSMNDEKFEKLSSPTFSIRKYAANLGFDTSLYESSPESKRNYVLGNLIPLTEEVYEKEYIPKRLRDQVLLKNFRADIVYNTEEDSGFD